MSSASAEQAPDRRDVRAEVTRWLTQHWRPDADARAWRAAVVEAGWAAPSWPSAWFGRGLPASATDIVREEFARAGAPDPGIVDTSTSGWWIEILGNTVLRWGSDSLRRRTLRPVLTGELGLGCLLYSEPGAGSDLAAVQTRAERHGDEFVLNGQKVWTSQASSASFGMLIARTNWEVPKHEGITFFLIPMRQQGVEVRPLQQITGEATFSEVFLTDARVSVADVVGEVDRGWDVLRTALAHERIAMAKATARYTPSLATEHHGGITPLNGAADLVRSARAAGRAGDPVVRQALAEILGWRMVQEWNQRRAVAETRAGVASSLPSLSKLSLSRVLHEQARLRFLIDGPAGLLYDYAEPDPEAASYALMSAFVNSIGGGSDQIQRNIIAERVLGMPRGHEPDRGIPFKDVRRNVPADRSPR